MLRITQAAAGVSAVICRIEGQLVGEWVRCLEELGAALLGDHQRVILDLGGLSYADQHGVDVLQQLTTAGVTIQNCHPSSRAFSTRNGGPHER